MSEQGPGEIPETSKDKIGWLPMLTYGSRVKRATDYDAAGISPEEYERIVLAEARGPEAKTVANVISEVIPITRPDGSPAVILDVAAGTGILSREIAAQGYQVIATDLSQRFLDYLKKHSPEIQTVQGDMNAGFAIDDHSVDGVTILGSNRYITRIPEFADEVRRVLRPGGAFVWPVFQHEDRLWRKNIGDRNAPTKPEALAGLLQTHGFSQTQIVPKHYSKTGSPHPEDADLSIDFVLGRVPTNPPQTR